MSLPTLILIHGAWHSPSCFDRIVPLLEGKGYKCVAPQLMYSVAHDDPSPAVESVEPDVRTIQSLIHAETSAKNDVVLLGHSLGGVPSSSALHGISTTVGSGRVIGLIEISAFMLPTGASTVSFTMENAEAMRFDASKDPWSAPDDSMKWMNLTEDIPGIARRFYADIPVEEGEILAKGLRKQSFGAMISEKGVYAGWKDVPVWYLLCTEDKAIPLDWQKLIVQQALDAGASVTTRDCNASHSPFYSRPDETVTFIVDAVNAFKGQ